MAWTSMTAVSVGEATKKSWADLIKDNLEHVYNNLSGSIGDGLTWPSSRYTSTDQNAQRIIFVDLDDPLTLWDYEAFMQQIQGTSWHDELGDPPVHGLMFITEAQNGIVWWNRETGAAYMTIKGSTATNEPIRTDSVITGIDFKDGVLYASDSAIRSVLTFDLMRDQIVSYGTSGRVVFSGDMGDRNSASFAFTLYNSSPAIVNATANDIAACRDPDEVDEFGRPKHWWAVGTDGGGSVYNPVTDAIYDSAITVDIDHLALSDDGNLVIFDDNGSRGLVEPIGSIFGISADGWSSTATDRWFNGNADATNLAWTDGESQTQQKPVILERASWASEGERQVWMASQTAGIYVAHTHPSDLPGKGGLIRLHEDYASPYMKGDVRGCWPLHSTADVSPGGHTLTNNNTVTFNNGGPAGSYADFNGTNQYLSLADHSDFDSMTELTVAFWVYRDVDAGGNEGYVAKRDDAAPGTSTWGVRMVNPDGRIEWFTNDTSTAEATYNSSELPIEQWHYIVCTWDNGTKKIWANGVHVGSGGGGAATLAAGDRAIYIGATMSSGSPAAYFDGRIAGVCVTASVMTEREIKAEYARGLRRLSTTTTGIDANTTISDNDIAAVAADPHGRYVAVLSDDKAVRIFDEFAVPVATDTYQGTTARDLAIKSMPNGTDPHYVIGGSDEFEVVQPDTRL